MFAIMSEPKNTSLLNENSSLCTDMTSSSNQPNNLQFHPIKVVVEPWRGEHNVYALFAVPDQYRHGNHFGKMLVKGTDTAWEVTYTDGLKYGTATPEGHFLLIGFFRTRLTLWYWLSGRFAELQQPCNWTLFLFR